MTTRDYIPTGRTSLVKSGDRPLQIQTEYAPHPYPRITTTVSDEGRVVHKVEMKLKRVLESSNEADRAQAVLTRQHQEVSKIVQEQANDTPALAPTASSAVEEVTVEQAELPVALASEPVKLPPAPEDPVHRLRQIPGVQHVFHLDNAGNFFSENAQSQFRRQFRKVFKGVAQLVEVFSELPGNGFKREQGVIEIERDQLYFASSGANCYFITVEPVDRETEYEKAISNIVVEEWID